MNIEDRAITFTRGVLRHAKDWQDAQFELANHPEFGPWLEAGDNFCADAKLTAPKTINIVFTKVSNFMISIVYPAT